MPAGKPSQSNTMLYTVITFVGLFLIAAVCAVLGGWLILAETMPLRNLIGCALMLAGMIISQLNARKQINLI